MLGGGRKKGIFLSKTIWENLTFLDSKVTRMQK